MRAIVISLCLPALLACLPGRAQAQYTGGIGRGDAQLAFVPETNVGLSPVAQMAQGPLRGWPVPTNGILYLDREVSASIHDANGRLVGNILRVYAMDTSGLCPGVYVLRTERGEVLRFIRD